MYAIFTLEDVFPYGPSSVTKPSSAVPNLVDIVFGWFASVSICNKFANGSNIPLNEVSTALLVLSKLGFEKKLPEKITIPPIRIINIITAYINFLLGGFDLGCFLCKLFFASVNFFIPLINFIFLKFLFIL